MNRALRTIKHVATRYLIVSVSVVIFAATASQFVLPSVRHVSYEVVNTATIAESPTTIGIADSSLYNISNADINKALDKMVSLGVTSVRIGVPWRGIQATSATKYDWSKMDYIVKAATDRGMGILGVLNQTPAWAGALGNGNPNPDVFATFAGAVAKRYAGKISAYEIWNEPNGFHEWNPVDPVAYTNMLKKAYTAIKAAAASTNQDIKVIGGVVGAGLSIGSLSMDPVTFVTKMYNAGAKGFFDAISFHPYNYTLKFSAGPANTWTGTSALAQLQAIRALMDVKGDAALKIWISEYGQPTLTGTAADQQKQAEYLEDMIRAWQSFLNGGPIFVYSTRDTAPSTSTVKEDHLGLFDYNWNAKKAAETIRKLILELTGTSTTPNSPAGGLAGAAQQLAAAVVSAVGTIVNLVPMTAMMLINAVKNLIGGIFGAATSTAAAVAAATTGARVASAQLAVTAEPVTADSVTARGADAQAPVQHVVSQNESLTFTAATPSSGGESATGTTAETPESAPVAEPQAPAEPEPAVANEPATATPSAVTETSGTATTGAAASDTKDTADQNTDSAAASSEPKATTGQHVVRPSVKFVPNGVKPQRGTKGEHDAAPAAVEATTTPTTPPTTTDSENTEPSPASEGTGDPE